MKGKVFSWKAALAAVVTSAVVAAAVWLPPALARRRDAALVDQPTSQPMKGAGGYRYQPTLIEKLRVQEYMASNVRSPAGDELSMEQAVEQARRELQRLQDLGVLPDCQVNWTGGNVSADFYEVTDWSGASTIAWTYWDISCQTQNSLSGYSWRIRLDAVTGKLLRVELAGVWESTPLPLETMAAGFAGYHELGEVKAFPHPSNGVTERTKDQHAGFGVVGTPVGITTTLVQDVKIPDRQYFLVLEFTYDPSSAEKYGLMDPSDGQS